MDLLLVFILGVVVGLVARRVLAAPAPPAGVRLETPAAPSTARLQELAVPLNAVGEASAHPRDLAENATFREAVSILASPQVPLSVVTDYASGANFMVATAACAALATRDDRDQAAAVMARQFTHLSPWPIYYALQFFTKVTERPPIGSLVVHAQEYWSLHPIVAVMLAEHFAARAQLGDPATFGDSLASATLAELTQAEALLGKVDHPSAKALVAELTAWRQRTLDRTYLQGFGRFIEPAPEHQLLVEHAGNREQLAAAEAAIFDEPHRSLLVVGEARAGKTSFLLLLAARAAARGWSVFEATGANVMAGQSYFGQLEERVQRLAAELAVQKRVVWYVPDLLQLAASGTHQGQTASLLDQVFPSIAAGKLVVLSEATPAGLTALVQRRPGLRSALELVRLPALKEADVTTLMREVAQRLSVATGLTIEEDVVDTAAHLARHYLGTAQMPGAGIDLLKLTAQRVTAHEGSEIGRQDVLATLSQLTGMPSLVLDDRERVDLTALRAFFTSRVMGQDEAVEAVVDRIAMVKAGLTDPSKPIGVFLFAGPTGTGKTELAKTLAEFLFGSPDRLIRLDMSEFQALESTRKILGDPDQVQTDGQALTQRVRRQPFSVVLLDEFEKAHPHVWDLFLQVFDDGRLTDAQGHTVDFRHCIIIATSNLGATTHQPSGLGFGPGSAAFSQDQVTRAVLQSFRPEFVNRLDAIIVFRPLTRELMRGILKKELANLADRRGLRHREWAVEWEASALDFLLDKGFSETMGARPLKRAIDRHLLAPLAATLVEHRFPQGDQFLFVRSDGRAIQVEFVDPDAPTDAVPALEPEPVAAGKPTLARMMLQPAGHGQERTALTAELDRIDHDLSESPWTSVENALVGEMQHRDFWSRPTRLHTLSRYSLMDRIKAAAGTARGLEARLARSASHEGRYSRDLISRLASQLYLIRHGIDDAMHDAAVEVALAVQPILESARDEAATGAWAQRIMTMYRNWAALRHMSWDELPRTSTSSSILAVVSGFGAARILESEIGLHVLEYEVAGDESARAVVRVKVVATPAALPDAAVTKRAVLLADIDNASASAAVVRRYRLGTAPLIRDVTHGWRTGRADLVLDGQFDLLATLLPVSG